jgi:hypothetical protein
VINYYYYYFNFLGGESLPFCEKYLEKGILCPKIPLKKLKINPQQ